MDRKELLKSKEYWFTEIQLNLFNLIDEYRKKHKLNQTQLAEKLGVTKGYISQILNGNFDHKVSKLVELALAFDKVPFLEYKDLEKVIIEDELDSLNKSWSQDLKEDIILNYVHVGYREISNSLIQSDIIPRKPTLSLSELMENVGQKTAASNLYVYEG